MCYKIIEILKSFSKDDIIRFRNFLSSPFFNESEKLLKFYEALIQFYPRFDSKSLTEEKLSSKVNPELPYKESTMSNLFSDLSIAAEKYFIHINLEDRYYQEQDLLRSEFQKRKLNKLMTQNIKKVSSCFDEVKDFGTIYLTERFKFTNDILNSILLNKPKSNSEFITSYVTVLDERAKYVMYFFIKEMFVGYDTLLTVGKTFNVDLEKNFISNFLERFNFLSMFEFGISNSTNKIFAELFEIYLLLYLAFKNPDEEKYYVSYKKLLSRCMKHLAPDEIRFHTVRLVRYCMIKSTDEKYRQKYELELFEVYKWILANGYYKLEIAEYIPVELYRTILLHSLKLKKYKWAYEFIHRYKNNLAPEKRKNMVYYSVAEYFFHREKFEDALKNFHKIELNHFMLKVDLKNLMLMTYYELGLYDNAISLLDSYQHFLRNDDMLSTVEKRKHKNFISLLQKMILYKTSYNYIHKYHINKIIQNNLPHKGWLNEKIQQLDEKYTRSA